jgi:hypothetical protein
VTGLVVLVRLQRWGCVAQLCHRLVWLLRFRRRHCPTMRARRARKREVGVRQQPVQQEVGRGPGMHEMGGVLQRQQAAIRRHCPLWAVGRRQQRWSLLQGVAALRYLCHAAGPVVGSS